MSDAFDAFSLPGPLPAGIGYRTFQAGGLTCRYPEPTDELLEDTLRRLRAARDRLTRRPVDSIVAAIDEAAARLADPADPIRRRALEALPHATAYSAPMTELVLDRMAEQWRAPSLRRLLEAELGDPAVLDAFTPAGPRRSVRALGPRLTFHVFAGNVPGVAVTSLVRSLLVKSPALGKVASGEPVLPVLFAEALRAGDPELAAALAVTYWPGGDAAPERHALAAADRVVVYGGDEAVASVRSRVPSPERLVVHGPRFSVGLIGARAAEDDAELARRVALAVATFDQQGCVSPHAIWVEEARPGSGLEFARRLAAALDALEAELPRGALSAAEASAIQQERGAAELRGHAAGGTQVFAGAGTGWTVVFDVEPAFRPSCLNRFIRVHPLEDLREAVDLLAPVGARLQSVALEADAPAREELATRLAGVGATRITTFDRLPWPPQEWHHDGSAPLRELLHWVDLEA